MKFFCHLTLALFTLTFAQVISAQELWAGLRYGMNPDQVRAANPKAETPQKPDFIPKSGAKELLSVRNLDIGAGVQLHAKLFFSNEEKLVQVNLEPMSSNISRITGIHIFEQMSAGLRAKYGPPASGASSAPQGIASRDTTWITQQTKIHLNMISFDSNSAIVSAIYSFIPTPVGNSF